MNSLIRVCHAEWLKLRHTLALWMCLIAPSVVVLMYVMMAITSKHGSLPDDAEIAWSGWFQAVSSLWSFMMLPLFITLEAALLAALEHGNQQWKHLLALPVPRWQHYVAKLAGLAVLVTLASAALLPISVIGGWLMAAYRGADVMLGWPPLAAFGVQLLASLGAAALMVSIHTWVSVRWQSFTASVAFGMSATVAGFLVSQSSRWGHYYPWGLPMRVFLPGSPHFAFVIEYGLIGGLVVGVIGTLLFARTEMG